MVECGSECLVLVAAVGYGYVVGVEAWAVVDSSVEVVACGTFDVAADAECDFAFAVEKEEAWRRGVGEVGFDGGVEYSDEVSAVVGVAGGYDGSFGYEKCVGGFLCGGTWGEDCGRECGGGEQEGARVFHRESVCVCESM